MDIAAAIVDSAEPSRRPAEFLKEQPKVWSSACARGQESKRFLSLAFRTILRSWTRRWLSWAMSGIPNLEPWLDNQVRSLPRRWTPLEPSIAHPIWAGRTGWRSHSVQQEPTGHVFSRLRP